jgi:subtilisin family serine protease
MAGDHGGNIMSREVRENVHGQSDVVVELVSPNGSAIADINRMGATRKPFLSFSPGPLGGNFTAGFPKGSVTFGGRAIGVTVNADSLDALRGLPGVERVYENRIFEVPHFPDIGAAAAVANEDNWGLDYLRVPRLRSMGLTGRGIKVGMLDSGINVGHPALSAVSLKGFKAFDFDGNDITIAPGDSQWHGSHVTGIIAGHNDGRRRGVAELCDLYVGQVLQGWNGSVASIKQGLIWMRDVVKPHVLNLSLGWPGLHDEWFDEIRDLLAAGTLICVA